ncbi:cysteine--tRNA ligase [Candidatus Woesearchaeota archaeon]|nr:MAG: cysteine--tRNA ligase [Candidatus Woesearchaeota archaeon]
MLKLYNTLKRKKEKFKPIRKGEVGLYTCGPTVYDYAHLGNFRAYVFYDLLHRYLVYKGFRVKHVMNITDVDDKTIRNSRAQGKSLKEYTEFYTRAFLEDMKTLNINLPEIMPKATEHIKEMVALIQKLVKNGHTYEKDGSIYFRISSFPDYGKLAHLDLDSLKDSASGRVDADEYEKEDAKDFVLWKAYTEDDGDVFWDTEIGKGRPGWHIECSAMSSKYLGETFDIHGGGIDLIFPHHTNEIAQSECANKKKFVNYWVHNSHLVVEGKKMSKSLGNFFTVRELVNKGYNPIAIRYELLATHYRQKLNFTFNGLDASLNAVKRLQDFILNVKDANGKKSDIKKPVEKVQKEFEDYMDDDLNIANALASIFNFVKEINTLLGKNEISKENAEEILGLMKKFDSVLGVMDFGEEDIPKEILDLVEKRQNARKEKNFAEADRIRDEIRKKGYELDDTPQGVRIKKLLQSRAG